MITEERLKYYEKEVRLINVIQTSFLMVKSGTLNAIVSSGITTIQYKINSGSFATPEFPISYDAGDVIWFAFTYSDQLNVTGNLIIQGKDD